MNDIVFNVTFSALIGYIGTSTSERMECKDDNSFKRTLAGWTSTLADGLRFAVKRR